MTLNDLIKYYKDNNISKDAEIRLRVGIPDKNLSHVIHIKTVSMDECKVEYHDPALVIYTPLEFFNNF